MVYNFKIFFLTSRSKLKTYSGGYDQHKTFAMVPLSGRDLIWPDGLPFRSFDPGNTGKIGEVQFRKIMKSKEAIPDEDVEEMLSGGQVINMNSKGVSQGIVF